MIRISFLLVYIASLYHFWVALKINKKATNNFKDFYFKPVWENQGIKILGFIV